MYGTQAELCNTDIQEQFENDVKMYGTQAGDEWEVWSIGLRMM